MKAALSAAALSKEGRHELLGLGVADEVLGGCCGRQAILLWAPGNLALQRLELRQTPVFLPKLASQQTASAY